MPRKKLRMYVWTDILTDYTSGMACALASSVEEAKKVLTENDPLNDYLLKELNSTEPEVVETPKGFYVFGGG